MNTFSLICGDSAVAVPGLAPGSVDAVVTDPPYGLGLRTPWDDPSTNTAFSSDFWCSCLHAAKPGAHLLAFGGARTWHRLACAIEAAGWEIRDTLAWLYGQGWPKSAGSLKPAWEPIIWAQRKDSRGRFPGLRAEVCRIPYVDAADLLKTQQKNPGKNPHNTHGPTKIYGGGRTAQTINAAGRWPANVVLDEAAAAMLESQVPGASRFFWCAKVRGAAHAENTHPTVKPVDLMRWLVRLVVAPGELVLDPFTGSGSTGVAALAEGARFVGVEREHVYVALARGRLVAAGGREQVMRRAVVRRITK